MADIKKIKLPRIAEAYNLYDDSALHEEDASRFDEAGAAAGALVEAKAYTDSEVGKLGAVLNFKGTKTSAAAIFAITDAKKGDVWLVSSSDADNGKEYVYIKDTAGLVGQENWEMFGVSTDLSNIVTKDNYNAHKHSVTVTGSNAASTVTVNTTPATIMSEKTAGSVTAGEAASYTGHSFTANVPTALDLSKFNGGSAATHGEDSFTAATISDGFLTGGSVASKAEDSFTANVPTTPAVINTAKFSGGSLSGGGVSGGVYSGATPASFTQGSKAAFTQGSKAAWSGTVSDDGTLSISWSANGDDTFTPNGDDSFTANNVGEVSEVVYTSPTLTPAAFQEGFYTAGSKGTAASFTEGLFTPNTLQSIDKTKFNGGSFTSGAFNGGSAASLEDGFYTAGIAAQHNVGTFSGGTPTAVTLPTFEEKTVIGAITSATAAGQTWSQTGVTVGTPDKQQA